MYRHSFSHTIQWAFEKSLQQAKKGMEKTRMTSQPKFQSYLRVAVRTVKANQADHSSSPSSEGWRLVFTRRQSALCEVNSGLLM
jgi:hypothetical protein